ncbi:MAG: hypothetical protein KF859_07820 [Phycisphaeraceae bacterium]|nr:hypothetical protein [Phycisphaeraceae bacterium]
MGAAPQQPPRTPEQGDKTTMRALGEFFGHVWKGITAEPAKAPTRRVTRHEVEQETRDTPQGKVTLRRTVIEEIELPPDGAPPTTTRGTPPAP